MKSQEAKLNTKEIRREHYGYMANLKEKYYDRGLINDSMLTFDYLHNRENYKPLGQRWRPFFIKPMYAKQKDFEQDVGWKRYLFRGVFGLLCIKIGYEVGKVDSVDKELANDKVVDFKSEE